MVSAEGEESVLEADVVVDATGTCVQLQAAGRASRRALPAASAQSLPILSRYAAHPVWISSRTATETATMLGPEAPLR